MKIKCVTKLVIIKQVIETKSINQLKNLIKNIKILKLLWLSHLFFKLHTTSLSYPKCVATFFLLNIISYFLNLYFKISIQNK